MVRCIETTDENDLPLAIDFLELKYTHLFEKSMYAQLQIEFLRNFWVQFRGD